ncbi:MAG: hypothetical protein EHM57_02770 [Actinobacteria bacterium]|nr:MAG: hypothetical protein EHM57_02770 [Actinomycetota bacterium]
MTRRPAQSLLLGAVVGALIAMGLMAFFGSFTALTTVSIGAKAEFVASQAAMTLLVLFCGALGGLLIAALAYGFGRMMEPDAGRFPLRLLLPGAMVLSAVLSYASVSLGVTLVGDVSAGIVTVPVAEMVGIVVIAGVIAGAAATPIVDALARPASIGPRNEATPVSSKAFWSDLMGAVGVPLLAAAIVASLAIGFSQVLLNAESTIVSVAAFSGIAAVILGATTLIALRPWDKT